MTGRFQVMKGDAGLRRPAQKCFRAAAAACSRLIAANTI